MTRQGNDQIWVGTIAVKAEKTENSVFQGLKNTQRHNICNTVNNS